MCDEYQEFASVGGKGSSGDEKAFALTRQSKVIALVATQSLAGLRAALGGDENLSLALLQTLRSKVFLSLGDEYSAKKATEMCGNVERMKASFGVSENTGRAGGELADGADGRRRGVGRADQELPGADGGVVRAAGVHGDGDLPGDRADL